MAATSSYLAYVDESGDEGFSFGGASNSSEWFVLSAVVARRSRDQEFVLACRGIRQAFGKSADYTLHFRDLKHEQKVLVATTLARVPMRAISVVCHKPSLTETEYLREKHKLYFYLSRFLFERVSWLCRDKRRPMEGDGSADIVFSNRSSMSYEAIRDYTNRLKVQSSTRGDINIDWTAINPDKITAVPHRLRAGLQVADAIASSVYAAFEPNRFGQNEPRYAKELLPVFYRGPKKRLWGYGVKVWPREKSAAVLGDDHYAWLRS